MPTDFYDILGVSSDAPDDEIRSAFRHRVKRYHPDVNEHPRAHAQFKVLQTAKDVLTDPIERDAYDRLGHREYVRKRMDGDLPTTDFPTISEESDSGGTTQRQHAGRRTTGGYRTSDRHQSDSSRMRSSRTTANRTHRSTTHRSTGHSIADRTIKHLWMAATLVTGIYLFTLGYATWANRNADVIREFATVIGGMGNAPFETVSALATRRFGIPEFHTLVVPVQSDGLTALSLAITVTMIGMVGIFVLSVVLLRRRTIWQPSWAYSVGAASPLVGLGINWGGISVLLLDVVLYFMLPATVLLVFLYHRFT